MADPPPLTKYMRNIPNMIRKKYIIILEINQTFSRPGIWTNLKAD